MRQNEKTKEMVAFMQKGVMCVGFPNLEDIDDGLKKAVEARMEMDAEACEGWCTKVKSHA